MESSTFATVSAGDQLSFRIWHNKQFDESSKSRIAALVDPTKAKNRRRKLARFSGACRTGVQADGAVRVDVAVVDARAERDLRRLERVVLGEVDLRKQRRQKEVDEEQQNRRRSSENREKKSPKMAESGKEIGRDNGHEGEVGRTHVEVEDSAAVRGAFRSHDGRPPLIERVAGLRRRLEKIEHIIFGHGGTQC